MSDHTQDDLGKSKSQVKRDMIALRRLGERLIELSFEQLNTLSMDDQLKEAVIEAKQMSRGRARKRQIQYIGKLMRSVDVDTIKTAIEKFDSSSRLHAQQFHKLERIRTGLMQDDSETIDELFAQHTSIDRQHLHQMIRKAQKERDADLSDSTHDGKLFRYLRSLQEEEPF
jgi:ribosome-associated protein